MQHLLKWFGESIRKPLEISSFGADQYVQPNSKLNPDQRVKIYQQQYWWRLQTILQKTFPLVLSVLGSENFNKQVAAPYLKKCLPRHWSIDTLGDRLPQWVKNHYKHPDRQLIVDASEVDWAFVECFTAQEKGIIPITWSPDEIFKERIWLQPHVRLFWLGGDLFKVREIVLKNQPFPVIEAGGHYYVYRNQQLQVTHQKINPTEFHALNQFVKGITLEKLCETYPINIQWIDRWLSQKLLSV